MKEQLAKIRSEALAALAGAQSTAQLDELRVKYLGKKGELTAVLKSMGKLSPEERPAMGQLANEVRAALEQAIEEAGRRLAAQALEQKLRDEAVDVTIPGKAPKLGHKHPMYIALDEIKDIFVGMGFTVLDGPEVELASYNFDKLNAGEGHPSRDWSDTFYFDEDSRVMLRSQTSPMQVRAMETMPLPIRIIAPAGCTGRTRWTPPLPHVPPGGGHGHDKGVTMAELKGTLNTVVEQLYGKGTKTRFPPPPLPLHRASCRDGRTVPQVRRRGLPHLQGGGLDRAAGRRMIHPPGAGDERHRPGGLLRLGLRHRPGAHRHAPVQNRRSAADLRERRALFGTILIQIEVMR